MASMDEQAQRLELIDTAKAYFLKYGFSRVSTSEIAERSGRSKKTLYKHFPTKERLLEAVLERISSSVEQEILAVLADPAISQQERVRQVLERIGVHLVSVSGSLYADLEAKEPTLYAQAREQQRLHLAELLRRIFRQAMDNGVFRSDIDVDATVATFLASVEALAKPSLLATHADQPTRLFSTLVSWVLSGVLVNK